MPELNILQLVLLGLIFVWSGFVRTGIGFGGAALALPFMLLIIPDPIVLLPVIATHFVIFSSHTLLTNKGGVDWRYCGYSLLISAIPSILGVLGLISLSSKILTLVVYVITFSYGIMYLLRLKISGGNKVSDGVLLVLAGYVSGAALTGAPLFAIVFARNVAAEKLRNTMFVVFLIIVVTKMLAFQVSGISWQFNYALLFLPAAAIGHYLGLLAHQRILQNDEGLLMRLIGLMLVIVTLVGLARY